MGRRRLLVGLGLVLWLCAAPAMAAAACFGERARPLAGWDIVHQRRARLEDYAGRWVLVEFTASWCGPCRRELDNFLARTAPYVADGRLAVVLASLDDASTLGDLKRMARRHRIRYPLLYDAAGFESAMAQQWGVHGVPDSFLIDPQGVIVADELRGAALVPMLEYFLGAARPQYRSHSWLKRNSDGSLAIYASVSNTAHAPVDLVLQLVPERFVTTDGSPAGKIVNIARAGKILLEPAQVDFDEWGETVYMFTVMPGPDWQTFYYNIGLQLPGTGGSGGIDDGLWCWYGTEQLYLVPVRAAGDGWTVLDAPAGAPRLYELETGE